METTGTLPVQENMPVLVWCSSPTGALRRVGQAEEENGLRSY